MNDDKFFEKEPKESRLHALIFLGIVVIILSIIFSFSVKAAILACERLSIIGAAVSGPLIILIVAIIGICSYKKKG